MVVYGDEMCQDHEMICEPGTPSSLSSLRELPPVSSESQEDPQEEGRIHVHYVPLSPETDLHSAILEAVALESKYQPSLSLPPVPKDNFEISARMRIGSCHVLRCLKVWYELPSDSFFLAVNTMDRFLTRMRAQPKHLSCIAVASFSVAAREVTRRIGLESPSRDSISVISQSKCTSKDVLRMEEIIRTKLDMQEHNPNWFFGGATGYPNLPVTPLTMLKLLHAAQDQLLHQHFPTAVSALPPLLPLIHQLEMVLCDTRATNCRPSELALALLKIQATTECRNAILSTLQPLIAVCQTTINALERVEEIVSSVLDDYNCSGRSPSGEQVHHRQRLVWKLSNRTLRQLKPTAKLQRYNRLPTINESCHDEKPYFQEAWKLRQYETYMFRSRGRQVKGAGRTRIEDDAAMKEKLGKVHMQKENGDYCCEEKENECRNDEQMEVNDEDTQIEKEGELKEEEDETVEKMEAEEEEKKEESYCQVAKKMREDKKEQLKDEVKKVSVPSFSSPTFKSIQRSPLSKITITPSLPLKSSSAVKNLSRVLSDDRKDPETSRYGYHHAKFVGVLEGIDGDVTAAQLANQKLPGKRKKHRVKLGLFTQIRYDSDTEMISDNASSSSEEEMDSDYEKQFPPLPVPRTPHPRLVRKKSVSSCPDKKKKKKSTPYPSKAIRKMQHTRKMAVTATQN